MSCKVVWFTGLSGSGKTTIGAGLYEELTKRGKTVKILDGDEIRRNIHSQLGFTREDIRKNNIWVAEMCKSLMKDYDYILVALISPFADVRKKVRKIVGDGFIELYVKASMERLIERDTKGLYKRALSGQILDFIGLSAVVPYEPPLEPDICIDTERLDRLASVSFALKRLL